MIPFVHEMCTKFAKLANRHYVRIMYARKNNRNPAYNARKAAQILAYFASKTDARTINILYVIKLVYLSDRESLKTLGFPLLNERRVAMDHGPVNSQTFDNIKQNSLAVGLEDWAEFILPKDGYFVSANRRFENEELDELSLAELDVLESVWKRFRHMDKWALRDWTHVKENVPEYDEPPVGTSTEIPLPEMCKTLGLNADSVDEIEAFASIDEIFNKLAS